MESIRDRVLLVDIGNTNLKWRWLDPAPGPIQRAAHRGIGATDLAEKLWGGLTGPRRMVVASVADPEWLAQLCDWVREYWGITAERVVSRRTMLGVTNAYPDPERLGVDRWLTLLAVHGEGLSPACIVDCGTAVTLDVIDAAGRHQGGLILAGRHLMTEALLQATHFPAEPGDPPSGLLGRDTGSAVRLAPLLAIAGMVEKVVRGIEAASGTELALVLTGNDAELLATRLGRPCSVRPDLVFSGLMRAAGEAA